MLDRKLNAREIAELWMIWESEFGESFMDYCGDDHIYKNISFLLGYWSVKFPELYLYLMNETNGNVPWKYAQDGLDGLVNQFYIDIDEEFSEIAYLNSILPWTSIIADNDFYYERFNTWMFEKDGDGNSQYDSCKDKFEEWLANNC